MIGSVLILFKGVTAYGESQIKAPNKISGSYQLEMQNLPNCLDSNNLTLKIEQSGIYLFAQLILDSDSVKQSNKQSNHSEQGENPVNKINLNGQLKEEQKISLMGNSSQVFSCQKRFDSSSNPLTIQGVHNGQLFSGKITWNAIDTHFKAYLEMPKSQDNKSE
jgi:hypothetical protein